MTLFRMLITIYVTSRISPSGSVITQINASESDFHDSNQLSNPFTSIRKSDIERIFQTTSNQSISFSKYSDEAKGQKPTSTPLKDEYHVHLESTTNGYSSPNVRNTQTDVNNKKRRDILSQTTKSYENIGKKVVNSDNISRSLLSRFLYNRSGVIFFKDVYIPESNSNLSESNNAKNKYYDINFFTFQVPKNITNANDITITPINRNKTSKEIRIQNNCSLTPLEHSNFTSSCINNLTENFNCQVSENDKLIFSISCSNISLYDASAYIPIETEKLNIIKSPQKNLLKPLFPHLTNLTFLRLHNNRHRYIKKAFTGLQNLKYLDLSNNNIMVLASYVFMETPNLKTLNISMNFIIRIRTIAIALSPLKYFTTLDLDHNLIIGAIEESELQPLRNTHLETLSLYNTTIQYISKGAFQHLPFLKVLDLSVNYMNEEALTNVTSSIASSSMTVIAALALNRLADFPYNSIAFLQNISIYRLDFSSNYFPQIEKLPYLPFLKSLWLSYCSINYIVDGAFSELSNLEELVLKNNELLFLPLNTSLPNLKTLVLNYQLLKTSFLLEDFQFENNGNLEELMLSNVLLKSKLSRNVLHGLNRLTILDLTLTELTGIEDYAFETLFSLKILALRGNIMTYLTNYTFYGLGNLTQLYLSSNLLYLSEPVYPFQYTPLLQILTIQNNKILTFPEKFFDDAYNLKILTISNNELLPWVSKILHRNASLKLLDLSKNQINFVTSAMISDFKQIKVHLDLSQNPFNCSACEMWEFQQFLNSSDRSIYYEGTDNYVMPVCAEPKIMRGQPILDAEISMMQCVKDDVEILNLISIVLIIIVVLFISILIYFCYFFRRYVRYWVFHFRVKVKEKVGQDAENGQNYIYDAFVSYNSCDNPWIVKHLIPALENEDPKYKLCVHERDFQIGRLITENILEAIENSRNVILILTEDFIKSEWCMFELHMAQHRLFDDTRDCLILVKFYDINKKLYTKNLRYLEKTRTCLTWTEDKTGQKLFWEKMKRVLGAPIIDVPDKEIDI
ncbi:toll-like receptor 2 [Trichonephila inaurata madagascariensis]|uniref:Toll-like receptor 2 n=1 Tax=Trichonephila inaurata madagascariensis TaxID=2747483 RepID=A0A8X6WVS0_9ARAC|nr:toll-like receptor 2 [Trichonephila inaurata madagascariensis]